jgi:hypothetical protein
LIGLCRKRLSNLFIAHARKIHRWRCLCVIHQRNHIRDNLVGMPQPPATVINPVTQHRPRSARLMQCFQFFPQLIHHGSVPLWWVARQTQIAARGIAR